MKAMTINNFGGTEEFVAVEVAKPQVTAGNVLVRIAATSVNTIDMMIRQMGADLPFAPKLPGILGMDFAGTIEAIGEGVTEFAVGDEIYGCAGGLGDLPGALAEFMIADKRLIAHKPKNLTMKEAAAIPLVGITALEGLTRANVSAGQKVLVHGGAGGVGHLAVQLAKHFGADVYSTGGNADQLALIESFGATGINFKDETVEQYVEKHTSNVGFDMVFDTVGGGNLINSFAAAKLNAQVSTTLSLLEVDLSPVHFKGLSLNVIFMLIPMIHDFNRQDHGDKLAKLAQIVEAGGMRPVLDEQDFTLEDTAKAHDRLASGQALGKVVINIQ